VCQLGQYDSIPTYFLWDERDGEQVLHMACANGTLRSIVGRDKIIPDEAKTSEEAEAAFDEREADFETQPPPTLPPMKATEHKRITKDNTNDDDSDDDIDYSGDAATSGTAKKSVSFVADEADEADDDNTVTMTSKEDDAPTGNTEATEDNDDDGLMADDDFADYEEHRPFAQAASLPEPQPPFAPSATPLELPRRIMCWNQIGTISYQRDDETGTRNTVDIDFTESATRRPISFSDNMDFILGSVGEDGAIFASDLTGDDDDDEDYEEGKIVDGLRMSECTRKLLKKSLKRRMNKNDGIKSTGSKIYFHRFETFGPPREKDWLLTLPDGERVVGCACGEGWSAVVTRYVFVCVATAKLSCMNDPLTIFITAAASYAFSPLGVIRVKLFGSKAILSPSSAVVDSWRPSTTRATLSLMELRNSDTPCLMLIPLAPSPRARYRPLARARSLNGLALAVTALSL